MDHIHRPMNQTTIHRVAGRRSAFANSRLLKHTKIRELVKQWHCIREALTAGLCEHSAAGGLRIVFEAHGYSPEMLSVYVLGTLDVVWVGSTDQLMAGRETTVEGVLVRNLTL